MSFNIDRARARRKELVDEQEENVAGKTRLSHADYRTLTGAGAATTG